MLLLYHRKRGNVNLSAAGDTILTLYEKNLPCQDGRCDIEIVGAYRVTPLLKMAISR